MRGNRYKIGHGFDIHHVDSTKKLILGGLLISETDGLVSNTDGDIVIHALFDAIVGALSKGDIGEYFPANTVLKSSIPILLKAKEMLLEEKYKIENIDITIYAETPNLSNYKFEIAKSLANTLDIDVKLVNVKAATMEKLGSIGASLAKAASAIVLIKKE